MTLRKQSTFIFKYLFFLGETKTADEDDTSDSSSIDDNDSEALSDIEKNSSLENDSTHISDSLRWASRTSLVKKEDADGAVKYFYRDIEIREVSNGFECSICGQFCKPFLGYISKCRAEKTPETRFKNAMMHILRKHIRKKSKTFRSQRKRHDIIAKTNEEGMKRYFYKGFEIFKIENGFQCGVCHKPCVGNPNAKYYCESTAVTKHISYVHFKNSIQHDTSEFMLI